MGSGMVCIEDKEEGRGVRRCCGNRIEALRCGAVTGVDINSAVS